MDLTIYPLLNFAVCDPVAGGMAAVSGLGALGGAMSGAARAKARNAAAKQNYEHMLRVREHEWYQQLSVWGAQRNKYYTDLTESDLAAQRGYAAAQVGLNDQFAAAAQRNESKLIEYLQGSGKLAAAGRTGRSIKRIGTLDLGALERSAGREFYKLTRSKQAYKANVENIRSQQISDQNQIWSRAAFAPIPDLAPPPPIFEKEGVGMMDILGVAAQATMGYIGAGGKFGNPLSGMKGTGKGMGNIFKDVGSDISFADTLKMSNTPNFLGSSSSFTGGFGMLSGSNSFTGLFDNKPWYQKIPGVNRIPFLNPTTTPGLNLYGGSPGGYGGNLGLSNFYQYYKQ